jgi:hypothetical protein
LQVQGQPGLYNKTPWVEGEKRKKGKEKEKGSVSPFKV